MDNIKMYIPTREEIIAYLGRHNIGIMQERDGQIKLDQCPFCGSGDNAKDAHNSGCYISIDTGKWQCWRKEKCNAHGTWKKFQKMLLLRDADMLDSDIQCGASDITIDLLRKAQETAQAKGLIITDYIDNTVGNGKVVDTAQIAARREQERKNRDYNVMDAADIMDLALSGDCYRYMVDTRKLDPDVLCAYNIVNDPTIAGVVLIPHMDIDGKKILFAKRRWIAPEQDCPKETTVKDTTPCFFGLQHLGHGTQGLIITEGQIDALSVLSAGAWDVGYDVISVPLGKDNFAFVSAEEKEILQSYNNIIVYGDKENGKISMVQDIEDIVGLPVSTIPLDFYHECKDANDILRNYGKSAIIDAIQHATVYAPHRVNISDIDLDGDDNGRLLFKTGYTEIDMMTGGIRSGKLILLAAKEGIGKSTLATQMLINAADAGIKSYIYSGEIAPKKVVKDLILQAAGPFSTTWTRDEETGAVNSVLRIPSHKSTIIDWLDKYIAIHVPEARNERVVIGSRIADDEAFKTVNNLIEDIEREAKRKTAEFFVIDNMTILLAAAADSNLFVAQSLLSQELKRICNNYNVTILLCVHGKKEQAYRSVHFRTDDISGSSDPKNFADLIMSLERCEIDTENDDDDGKYKISHTWDDIVIDTKKTPSTILRVLKNRDKGIVHKSSGDGTYYNRDLGIDTDKEGCFLFYLGQCKSLLDADQTRMLRMRNTEGLIHGWTQNVKMV